MLVSVTEGLKGKCFLYWMIDFFLWCLASLGIFLFFHDPLCIFLGFGSLRMLLFLKIIYFDLMIFSYRFWYFFGRFKIDFLARVAFDFHSSLANFFLLCLQFINLIQHFLINFYSLRYFTNIFLQKIWQQAWWSIKKYKINRLHFWYINYYSNSTHSN
jgi:hypothetical protein